MQEVYYIELGVGDEDAILVGNSPFIVNRKNDVIHHISTGLDIEQMISQYEKDMLAAIEL